MASCLAALLLRPHARCLQISALLTPLIFDRPSVLLSVQLVGAPASSLETLAVGAASRPLLADSSTAVAAALSQLPAAPLPGCAPAAESFVQELACFSSAGRAAAARHALAPASPLILAARLSLFAAGDEAALLEALHAATEALGASATSGAALQLVLLDDHPMAPLPSGAAAAGGEWGHEASRRSLLQSGASPRSVDAWHAKVAAFGVGILLAVAIAGTIVALCTMQTQNDSMLFAKTKEL